MLRHFREQYKTDLIERTLVLQVSGPRVLIKELKVCAFNLYEIFRKTLKFFSQVVIASETYIIFFVLTFGN